MSPTHDYFLFGTVDSSRKRIVPSLISLNLCINLKHLKSPSYLDEINSVKLQIHGKVLTGLIKRKTLFITQLRLSKKN